VLEDPYTAMREIDRVLAAALEHKRPVYIELPRDMVGVRADHHRADPAIPRQSDPESLREAVDEAAARLRAARQPVILAGVELHRFGLQERAVRLARSTNTPVADTLLSKSVIGEHEPFYLGLYQGAMSRDAVREYVETSDCVLLLGVLMTDVNLGVFTTQLDPARCISASADRVAVGYHTYDNVRFDHLLDGLLDAELPQGALPDLPRRESAAGTGETGEGTSHGSRNGPDVPITVALLYDHLGSFLARDLLVIADTGDAMFAAGDLQTYQCGDFIAGAYYCSLGFAVPAALGAQLARPELRPLVLVGDGAFQMTGLELSTAVRFGLNPIVVVLNNDGYAATVASIATSSSE
jgi:indolepyruvate decarboxylase